MRSTPLEIVSFRWEKENRKGKKETMYIPIYLDQFGNISRELLIKILSKVQITI